MSPEKRPREKALRGLRFTAVGIESWRNFTRAEVPLRSRAFLVGPNAAGKSNFLDVFRFLSDLASPGGGLQGAVARRGGVSRLRALAARQHSDVTLRVGIGSDEEPRKWEYHLGFGQDSEGRPAVREERVLRGGELLLARPRDEPEDRRDPERLTQTHLEQVGANRDFRELAAFLASVCYVHIVPHLVRKPERSAGVHSGDDPYGGDLLDRIARAPERTRASRLRKIRKALCTANPHLGELELRHDERGRPHLRARYEHWRPQGAWQDETQLSDGTLRLLGLLWAVLDGSGPLLLEEPELSLHPEVVRQIPRLLSRVQRPPRRQILASTHSRDLLDDKKIQLDEILFLLPTEEGTAVRLSYDLDDIPRLLEEGLSLTDGGGHPSAAAADQLSLFGK